MSPGSPSNRPEEARISQGIIEGITAVLDEAAYIDTQVSGGVSELLRSLLRDKAARLAAKRSQLEVLQATNATNLEEETHSAVIVLQQCHIAIQLIRINAIRNEEGENSPRPDSKVHNAKDVINGERYYLQAIAELFPPRHTGHPIRLKRTSKKIIPSEATGLPLIIKELDAYMLYLEDRAFSEKMWELETQLNTESIKPDRSREKMEILTKLVETHCIVELRKIEEFLDWFDSSLNLRDLHESYAVFLERLEVLKSKILPPIEAPLESDLLSYVRLLKLWALLLKALYLYSLSGNLSDGKRKELRQRASFLLNEMVADSPNKEVDLLRLNMWLDVFGADLNKLPLLNMHTDEAERLNSYISRFLIIERDIIEWRPEDWSIESNLTVSRPLGNGADSDFDWGDDRYRIFGF